MATLNRSELDRLEKRELQLTILAAVFVLVLAGGLAVFMYPLVFLHPIGNNPGNNSGNKIGNNSGNAACIITMARAASATAPMPEKFTTRANHPSPAATPAGTLKDRVGSHSAFRSP